MSTPVIAADAFVDTDDTPRKLSGRSAERSQYFDLITSMADSGKAKLSPSPLKEDDYNTLLSDLRTGLRQVNVERTAKGLGQVYLSQRRVIVHPDTGKATRKGTQFLWFKITDQPGRKVGPRVDRANGEAPAESQPVQEDGELQNA